MTDLRRPIIGIENRTAQEVFDIMCDRIQARERALKDEIERVTKERDQALEAEDEAKDCFWAVYPRYLESGGEHISTEAARTTLADRAEAAEAKLDEAKAVLEPFANFLGEDVFWDRNAPDNSAWLVHDGLSLIVGPFRRARTFLSTLTEHIDGDVSKSAEKSNTSDATYTAEDGLRRAREIAVQSEAAPLCMGEIVKVVDMALGERTALPEWMLKDPAPVITADMVDRACRAYALARYDGAAVWPNDFTRDDVEATKRDMRAAIAAALSSEAHNGRG